jgi:Sulfotransferase family
VQDLATRLVRRLRGVRVEPSLPPPPPVDPETWARIEGACVIGATGGSGTRVLARFAIRGGMFIGVDRNRSEDALDFAAFSDRWVDEVVAGRRPGAMSDELHALAARQWAGSGGGPWGWKEPRSIYLLPLLDEELAGLRFLHVVRDGRDMAYSANQVQLRKHGAAVLGDGGEMASPRRSIALWSEVNLRAADYGERELGPRYLRVRFEDLCLDPEAGAAEVLRFFGLAGDAALIAGEEVTPPPSLGRWQDENSGAVAELEAVAGEALRRFGYQSSSA